MNRPDHKGNSNKPADHLRLYRWLTDSAAWQHLTTDARALYVLFKTLYRGNNNGRLVLSVRQAADGLCIGKTTASKAFDELADHGFIEVVILGSFSARKDGRATE